MLRLGICDAIPADFRLPGDPGEPEKFIAMFESIAAPFTYKTYRVTEGHFPESKSECDAYLITGSPCGVNDGYAWIAELQTFIREVFAVGQPIVGVCFGHQLIAQSLGGHVERAKDGWLLGLHEIEVSARKAWMNSGSAALPLYFINQDQVVELRGGDDLDLLGHVSRGFGHLGTGDDRLAHLVESGPFFAPGQAEGAD